MIDKRDLAVRQVSDALNYLINSLKVLNSCDGIYDLDLAEAITEAFPPTKRVDIIKLLVRDLQSANEEIIQTLEDT